MIVWPVATLIEGAPIWASLSTRIRSGFSSNSGTVAGASDGGGVSNSMPGSRKGRGVPVITAKNTPFEVDVAACSSTFPWVGATTVSDMTATRMLSNRSSCCRLAAGFGPALGSSIAAVSMTGAGSALPVELTVMEAWPISVSGSWKGSAAGEFLDGSDHGDICADTHGGRR